MVGYDGAGSSPFSTKTHAISPMPSARRVIRIIELFIVNQHYTWSYISGCHLKGRSEHGPRK